MEMIEVKGKGMGTRGFIGLAVVFLLLGLIGVGDAQGQVPQVAFVNNSGQLVVASGDGLGRWIVTNPGEVLADPLGFSWSPNGRQLFFAVSLGGTVSLRVGDVASQSFVEIGQASGALSGGEWTPDGRALLIGADNALLLYAADGSGAQVVQQATAPVGVVSTYVDERPYLATAYSLSPDGRFIFYWQSEGAQGRYAIYNLGTGAAFSLPGANDTNARKSGLWADSAPLVTYWGVENGSSVLSVTNADNQQSVTLNSGRTAPITPVTWRPGTQQLIYRDATNYVRLADMSCLNSGCSSNPLENGVALLPATATDIQVPVRSSWLFFLDGETVKGLDLTCIQQNSCLDGAVILGQNVAQRTWLHVAGNTLIYTAYTLDAGNANDREVQALNLGCLSDPASCRPTPMLAPAVAGMVASDGAYVVVDMAGQGLNALHLPSLNMTYLSGSLGGQLGTGLNLARWN